MWRPVPIYASLEQAAGSRAATEKLIFGILRKGRSEWYTANGTQGKVR